MPKTPYSPGAGWTPYTPSRRTYPELGPALRRELDLVHESRDGGFAYKPCQVTIIGGSRLDCVYVQDANSYIDKWGVWPDEDRGNRCVDVSQVVHIKESPTRLPPHFAEELYQAGESCMGGCFFAVLFSDGTRQNYETGNAVDFVPYPDGKTPEDVIRVFPHEPREAPETRAGLPYHWCLYGTGESHSQSWRRND